MNIGGIELNVGDTVSYIRYNEYSSRSGPRNREGKIIHMTDTIITVDLGQYRDSFSLQDLACGTVEIPGMNPISITTSEIHEPYRARDELTKDTHCITKRGRRTRQPLPRPTDEELANVYNDGNQTVKFVQDFYKISKSTARRWLQKAGLLVVQSKKVDIALKEAEKRKEGLIE
jgi:hypothetical protein